MKLKNLFLVGFFVIILTSSLLAASYTFVVLGDSRDGDQIFKKILNQVENIPELAFVVHTGDGVRVGSEANFKKYLAQIEPLKNKWYQVIGNHELYSGGYSICNKYFPKNYYSFTYQNDLFVILDNAFPASFDDTQLEWLENTLAEKEKDSLFFVFLHCPLFDPSGFSKSHIMGSTEYIEKLFKVFKKYRVNYVMAGHIHGYARKEQDGTVFIITGGAGAPIALPPAFGGFNHYIIMKVADGKVEEELKVVE